MKKLLQMSLCCFCCVGFLCGCDSNDTDTKKPNEGNSQENEKTDNKKEEYVLGKAFKFDDLEITIGNEFTYTVVDNEYSDHHQAEVIKIPVTVKNLKDETHGLNMFYYNFYGSKGTRVDTVAALFSENNDSVDFAGDLRTDASYTKYFYVIYDGDGTYTIEFNNFSEKISIDFEVKKAK